MNGEVGLRRTPRKVCKAAPGRGKTALPRFAAPSCGRSPHLMPLALRGAGSGSEQAAVTGCSIDPNAG